jgi:hypothetical protein
LDANIFKKKFSGLRDIIYGNDENKSYRGMPYFIALYQNTEIERP